MPETRGETEPPIQEEARRADGEGDRPRSTQDDTRDDAPPGSPDGSERSHHIPGPPSPRPNTAGKAVKDRPPDKKPARSAAPPAKPKKAADKGKGGAKGGRPEWDRVDEAGAAGPARASATPSSQQAKRAAAAAGGAKGGAPVRGPPERRIAVLPPEANGGRGGFMRRATAENVARVVQRVRRKGAAQPAASRQGPRGRRPAGDVAPPPPSPVPPPAPQPPGDDVAAAGGGPGGGGGDDDGDDDDPDDGGDHGASDDPQDDDPEEDDPDEPLGSDEEGDEDEEDADELDALLEGVGEGFGQQWHSGRKRPAPYDIGKAFTVAQVQRIGAAGGISAISVRGQDRALRDAPTPKELRSIPDTVVIALFGTARAAVMRLTASSDDAVKGFAKSRACALLMERDGYHVPEDFYKRPVFFHFQLDHFAMLRRSPMDLHKVEEWFYGFARWAVQEQHDETHHADFAHICNRASELNAALVETEAALAAHPGTAFRATVRTDGDRLITQFSAYRTKHVRRAVAAARVFKPARKMVPLFDLLERAFVHLHASLPDLLVGVFTQLASQGKVKGTRDQQEEYVSRATIGVYRAFICGLSSSEFNPSSFKLTTLPAPISSLASAAGFASTLTPSTTQSASTTFQAPSSVGFTPSVGGYTTVQGGMGSMMLAPQVSLDTLARQVAHGYRSAGLYVGPGAPGGANEGIDLTPESRRLLHAYQTLAGHRQPGQPLCHAPPELPPLAPFLPAYVTTQVPVTPPTAPSSPASSNGGYGYGSSVSRPKPRPLFPSDELHVPFSVGMLGSWSPYRLMRPPESCYECNMTHDHFAHECPARFLRVRGELPPGWHKDGGAVVRDPTKWIGQDLTDATRQEYRNYLAAHRPSPHPSFPVSTDEIVAPQPAAPRQPARRRP